MTLNKFWNKIALTGLPRAGGNTANTRSSLYLAKVTPVNNLIVNSILRAYLESILKALYKDFTNKIDKDSELKIEKNSHVYLSYYTFK